MYRKAVINTYYLDWKIEAAGSSEIMITTILLNVLIQKAAI
jgi:hypothetical protein